MLKRWEPNFEKVLAVCWCIAVQKTEAKLTKILSKIIKIFVTSSWFYTVVSWIKALICDFNSINYQNLIILAVESDLNTKN